MKAEMPCAPFSRSGLGVDEQHVGDGTVGDVDLAAVQNVVVALAARGRAHRTQRVGAGAGLGQAKRADLSARAEIGQIFAALLLVAVAIDVVGAEIVVRDAGQRHRVIPAAEGLHDQTGRDEIQSRRRHIPAAR